jgi:alkylated DNA repair dioxygenase AlkB
MKKYAEKINLNLNLNSNIQLSLNMNALFYNLEPGCYALLIPGFIQDPEDLYAQILEEVDFEAKSIKMFDKSIPLPRLTSYYSSVMKTGFANTPREMLSFMDALCERFQEISKLLICPSGKPILNNLPNSCLVNYYRNGDDYIGWHADDEQKSYILNPIYSISLGEERIFQLRNEDLGRITDIKLGNGSLLIMYGDQLQIKYKHRVPKTTSEVSRVNLTFRFYE